MKNEMINFEKSKRFNEKMYVKYYFSSEEIKSLKNNSNLNKMFEVMEIETSLNQFKDLFSCMISNIVYQLVAFKIAREGEIKLFSYLDYNVTPDKLLQISDNKFKELKIYGQRIKYIREFSKFVLDNQEWWNDIEFKSEEEIEKKLKTVTGIGSWSIEMFFIFGMTKSNILSLKDLIILKGLNDLYTDADLKAVKNEISDYSTITSINLWKYIEGGYFKLK